MILVQKYHFKEKQQEKRSSFHKNISFYGIYNQPERNS
nr:MAG TPA: hypothetical protein [Caudoviricetes sp.]